MRAKATPEEENFTCYEFKVLATVKALEKFRVYLWGIEFKMVTDCQAFAMTTNKNNSCLLVHRWAFLLAPFKYTIVHRPGRLMAYVDALSRNSLPEVMLIEECKNSIIARLERAKCGKTSL